MLDAKIHSVERDAKIHLAELPHNVLEFFVGFGVVVEFHIVEGMLPGEGGAKVECIDALFSERGGPVGDGVLHPADARPVPREDAICDSASIL